MQDISPSNVTWYHAGAMIDFDGPRCVFPSFCFLLLLFFFLLDLRGKKKDKGKRGKMTSRSLQIVFLSRKKKRRGGGGIKVEREKRRPDIRSVLSEFVLNNVFTFDRGGVSLETEKGKNGTTSKLLITRAQHDDSGNYTCVSSKVAANVMVHVLNGENKIIDYTTPLLRRAPSLRREEKEPIFFLPSNSR